MAVKSAGGSGEALSPTIEVENNVPALEAALKAAKDNLSKQFYYNAVANANRSLQKAEARLEAAKTELATAEAELVAFEAAEAAKAAEDTE